MNWVDVIILTIVSVSCLFGLWRGFVREVLSLLAWIAALLVASFFSSHLAPMFSGFIESSTVRYVMAFVILCLITLLIGGLINHFMSKLVSLAGLLVTDRLLGAFFGVARGVIIVAVVAFFASAFYAEEPWWQESELMPHVVELIDRSRLFIEDPESHDSQRVTFLSRFNGDE
jgi:membrane protein required for colicin V production